MRDRKNIDAKYANGAFGTYLVNMTSGMFYRNETVSRNRDQYGVSVGYKNEDWFGVGLALTRDPILKTLNLIVGAPRWGKGVYSYYKKTTSALTTPWVKGQFLTNPNFQKRTFFGSVMRATKNANFLAISDAAGSTGRGTVYLYHRRNPAEGVFQYENVAKVKQTDEAPYFYERIGVYYKTSDYANSYFSYYNL